MFGREHGSKVGSGGTNSGLVAEVNRREILRQLALERIDLSKDPYIMKNHLGTYDCRLCMTTHPNEGNYLAHTQGRRHQTGLSRRAARNAQLNGSPKPFTLAKPKTPKSSKTARIGPPVYRYLKQRDHASEQRSLLFMVEYPEIEEGLQPRVRIMSAYEQKIEHNMDKNFQYLLFAAEPYNNIAFRIPNIEIEREFDPSSGKLKFWTHWDKDAKVFTLQIYFKDSPADIRERQEREQSRRQNVDHHSFDLDMDKMASKNYDYYDHHASYANEEAPN